MSEASADTVTNVASLRAKQRRDWRPAFLFALESEGTVSRACRLAGISRTTAYRERQANEEFAIAWADVESTVIDAVESKAVQVALAGDSRMIEFLLKHRRPDVYRDRIEHSGRLQHDLTAKSDSELAEIAGELAEKLLQD